MIKRIATAVAVFGAASFISGCAIEQPSAGCIVQDSSFAAWQAKYVLKSQDKAGQSCGQLKGETLGVWKYTDPEAKADVVAANKASRLAIRPHDAAALVAYTYKYTDVDADGKEVTKSQTATRADKTTATALSTTLTEETDAEGFCKATGFSGGKVEAAAVTSVKTGEELKPATTVDYKFGDVEVYSHPSAPGTQLRGSLTYTDGTCTAEYEVWALWPAVGCVPGSAKPAENCGEGSGLNPDFDAVCDADLEACVPAKRPKSFKGQ